MKRENIGLLIIDRLLNEKETVETIYLKYQSNFEIIIFKKENTQKIVYSKYKLVHIIDELFCGEFVETKTEYTKNQYQYYVIEIDSPNEELSQILKKKFTLDICKLSEIEKTSK